MAAYGCGGRGVDSPVAATCGFGAYVGDGHGFWWMWCRRGSTANGRRGGVGSYSVLVVVVLVRRDDAASMVWRCDGGGVNQHGQGYPFSGEQGCRCAIQIEFRHVFGRC